MDLSGLLTTTEPELSPHSQEKAENAKSFDEIYSIDTLRLSEPNIEKNDDNFIPGRPTAGSSFPKTPLPAKGHPCKAHSFSDCHSSSFSLRVGPNYAKHNKKAPAGPSLYEVVGAE